MADPPSFKEKDENKEEPPAPEVLQPKTDTDSADEPPAGEASQSKPKPAGKRPVRSYRPSHKATFIGLAVVILILVVNSAIIAFIVKRQNKENEIDKSQVTINQSALENLGVKRNNISGEGVELTVNPDARFNGKVNIASDTSIAGQLILSKKLSASDASLTQLQAGKTSLSELNVNGDGTLSNLALRNNLSVAGNTKLQGAVIATNSVNIAGNLSIGGQLSVNTLHVRSIVSENIIQLGGHLITYGLTPSVSRGSDLGSNGSVSISGNDAAGTVAVNAGTGAGSGTLATVFFRNSYSGTPRVVITPSGRAAPNVYVTTSNGSFSILYNGSLPAGGYRFNYIVFQ